MAEHYDWSSFYNALCQFGPNLLQGIDDDNKEIIQDLASTTDMFWSDGLQDCLARGSGEGNLRGGILSALELWRENVLQALDESFGIELDWQAIQIDTANPLVDELVAAAAPK
jgi:hypothetical protein